MGLALDIISQLGMTARVQKRLKMKPIAPRLQVEMKSDARFLLIKLVLLSCIAFMPAFFYWVLLAEYHVVSINRGHTQRMGLVCLPTIRSS